MRRRTRSRRRTSAIARPMPKRLTRRRSFLMSRTARTCSFRFELLLGKLRACAGNARARRSGGALQVAACARIVLVELQRFGEIGDGRRRLLLAQQRLAARVESPRERSIGLDRARVLGNGAVELAAPRMDDAAVVERLCVAGAEPEGLVEIGERAFRRALPRIGLAAVVEGLGRGPGGGGPD